MYCGQSSYGEIPVEYMLLGKEHWLQNYLLLVVWLKLLWLAGQGPTVLPFLQAPHSHRRIPIQSYQQLLRSC